MTKDKTDTDEPPTIASAKQDPAHEDFTSPLTWHTYRRYRLLRAAATGLERAKRVVTDALIYEGKKRGHFRLPFLSRDEAIIADLASAAVDALLGIRALDMITPGIEVEALADEQDRLARQKRQTRRETHSPGERRDQKRK